MLRRELTAADVILFPPVDLVVNNTDPNLQFIDTLNDGEPSIGINPTDPSQIVVLAFSGSWFVSDGQPQSAPLWFSTDGGGMWTKEFHIPPPPGTIFSGCPDDQTPDYTRDGTFEATFLNCDKDTYTGDTVNPGNPIAWNWLLVDSVAQRTNRFGVGDTDQPWLLVNRDPTNANQDNVYVAYDAGISLRETPVRVAVALGPNLNPPTFARDAQSGTSGPGENINPGHRLAVDPRMDGGGAVYSLFQSQRPSQPGDIGFYRLEYRINRSRDGGQTWPLRASANGCDDGAEGDPPCVITPATSTQATPFKFGNVNALLGGVDHLAVDPGTGDVFVVYGDRDGAGNNLLFVDRLGDNGTGGIRITGGPTIITPVPVQAALPSIAVANDQRNTVGVLYDTADGDDPRTGLPRFTAHFTLSMDHGATFNELFSFSFLSPARDNGDPRQRVLGDYQQLKALGDTFYGIFTANGAAFGRVFANNDPAFFKVIVGP